MLCLMDTFVPLKEKIMKDLMVTLANELRMSCVGLHMNSIGMYAAGVQAYPTVRGVHLKHTGKPDEFVDCTIARGKLMRLMSDPILMREDIRHQTKQILDVASKLNHGDVKFKIEEERVMILSDQGRFRINVNTRNITKLIGDRWIIIDTPEYLYDRVSKLHGTLIQVGLM